MYYVKTELWSSNYTQAKTICDTVGNTWATSVPVHKFSDGFSAYCASQLTDMLHFLYILYIYIY